MGKGYIVGAGPGDIGLITKKGLDLIGIADVILYDRLIDKKILGYAKKECELFYVGKSSTTGGETQNWINEVLVEKTKVNDIVVRLHGGDPFLFGRGSEEIDELVKNGLDYEIVPGISSSFAVPTYGGIPVTKRDLSASLHIFTARSGGGSIGLNFDLMSKLEGTIVILMGLGVIEDISKCLIESGMNKSTIVSVISEGTTSKQKSIKGNLENIAKLVAENNLLAPAIIVVGGTADLLGKYDWFSKRRLFGKRVILTRDIDSFGRSAKYFDELGAETISLPMIELKTNLDKFNDDLLEELKTSDILSFNSPKAVQAFFEGLKHIGKDLRVVANNKLVCIGSGTVEELSKYNVITDYVPKEYSVKSLLKELAEVYGSNKKVILLSSDIHGRDEKELSKEFDLDVKIKDIYTNKGKRYETGQLTEILKVNDYITFLSSSAVSNFVKNSQGLDISKLKLVSIGPMTSKTIRAFGLKVDLEATNYSLEGIRDLIVESLEK